jgi:hypothetical protein
MEPWNNGSIAYYPAQSARVVLSHQIRKQPHKARALDGIRELALMPLAHAGALARHDLAETRKVPAERIRVFIINRLRIHFAKVALTINLLLRLS